MKKILSLAFIAVFAFVGFAGNAQAAVVCDSPDHSIWNSSNDTKVGCISDVAWKIALASQQATDNDLQVVPRGTSVKLAWGFVDTCPVYIMQGCVIKKSLLAK